MESEAYPKRYGSSTGSKRELEGTGCSRGCHYQRVSGVGLERSSITSLILTLYFFQMDSLYRVPGSRRVLRRPPSDSRAD